MTELNLTTPQILLIIAILLPFVALLWADTLTMTDRERAELAEALQALEGKEGRA